MTRAREEPRRLPNLPGREVLTFPHLLRRGNGATLSGRCGSARGTRPSENCPGFDSTLANAVDAARRAAHGTSRAIPRERAVRHAREDRHAINPRTLGAALMVALVLQSMAYY